MAVLLLNSCDANKENFGKELVYLNNATSTISVESSYLSYDSVPDPNESPEKKIYVAGVGKSGYFLNPSNVNVELEIDKEYVDSLLNELANPNVVMTDELKYIDGGMLLPDDCYTIDSLSLTIPANKTMAAVPVKLNMEMVKKLNPYIKWILPAFKIKLASIDINPVIQHTIVVLNFKYIDFRPAPDPLTDDLTGWTNIILNLPKTQIMQCPWWDTEAFHGAQFTVDGNKDINTISNRWVPITKTIGTTVAPWVEYDLGGKFDISGLKIYYMNEIESGQTKPTPRANCYLWAKIDNRWFKQEELLGNTVLTPSYQLDIKNVTNIRITWDLIIQPTVSYFLKVKEIEIYTKP